MALLQRTYEPVAADGDTAVQQPVEQPEPVTETALQHPVEQREPVTETRAPRRFVVAGASTTVLIARVIRAVAAVVAAIIALGIAFVLLKATPTNTTVSHVHAWAKWLVGPFDDMFHLHGARATLALNWGIGLVVYMLIAAALIRLVTRPARALRRRRGRLAV